MAAFFIKVLLANAHLEIPFEVMVAFFYAWVLVAVGINAAKADIDVVAVAYDTAACQYLFRLSQADACAGDDICLFHCFLILLFSFHFQ